LKSGITWKAGILVAGIIASAAGAIQSSERPQPMSFGCNDLVIVGRIRSLSFEHVEIENDLLGHGWISARVRIRRILRGHERARTVPVRYFAHTYLRDDRDFLLALVRHEGEGYQIRNWHMLEGPSLLPLAASCTQHPE